MTEIDLGNDDMVDRIAQLSEKTAYTASGSGIVVGVFSISEIVSMLLAVVAVATFFMSWFYRHRMYLLAKQRERNDE